MSNEVKDFNETGVLKFSFKNLFTSRKKKEPESVNWMEAAQKDFNDFIAEISPKWKALNQKHFKKDTGFCLMSSRFGEFPLRTEIEGLGMINEYFFKAIHRDCKEYLQDKSYVEIEEFCDELKQTLLKDCYMKL